MNQVATWKAEAKLVWAALFEAAQMAGLAAARAAAISPAACWLVTALKELWSSFEVTGAVY